MANAKGTSQSAAARRRRTAGSAAEADRANPTVRQRELGSRLRALRHAMDLTVEDVGARLECSATKISRIETGARRASVRDVRDLCELYGVIDRVQAEELISLARQARELGWWSRYVDPRLHDAYIGLEQDAAVITSYSMYWVPALLQTPEYARALVLAWRRIEPQTIDERVDARMRRQGILEQARPPRYRALLDEAVLHREVGGPEVMAAQLGKILDLMADGKCSVQIIPFSAGAHAGSDSNLDLLEFGPDSGQKPVVYVESLFSALYYERPADVERYREAVESLRESALNALMTRERIAEVRQSYSRAC